MLSVMNLIVFKILNSDKIIFTFSHKTELCVVWAASIFSYVISRMIICTDWKSTVFSTINEKTSEIRFTKIFQTRVAQTCITFHVLLKKWLWKRANSLLQFVLKLCVTKRAVQRHAFFCVASYFAQKRCVADSTRKQWVNYLYRSRWKS